MTTTARETESDTESRLVRIETRLDSMATKEDLANLGGEVRTEMATRFGELETKIAARFGEQDAKMEARFGELKADNANLKADFIRWMVGTIAISTTVVVSVVTLVGRLSG